MNLQDLMTKLMENFTLNRLTATAAAFVAAALAIIATEDVQLSLFGIQPDVFEPILVALIGALATTWGVTKAAE